MSKLGLVGLVLALGGCFGGGLDLDFGPDLGLQDAWDAPGLESRYMVGSVFPVEITRPERPVDEYEVESLDPEVLRIVRTGIDFEATALALGNTSVELRADGEVLRRYAVEVTEPDAIELTVEREDRFGSDLTRERTLVGAEVAMLAGQTLDIHVRYFDEGIRVYGGDVVSIATEMPAAAPEWSPQGNVVRLEPDALGTFPITFGVGALEETIDVVVAPEATRLVLIDSTEASELDLLVDPDGQIHDQVIEPEARDAEGRVLRGTLPIAWTVDLDTGSIVGEGTMLGVISDGTRNPVTARLGGLTATSTALGVDVYIAP